MIERFYINGNMAVLKNVLSNLEFLDGYTVSIDIDWTKITKEMPSADPYYYDGPEALDNVEGATDTVYVVKEGDNLYRLYLYNEELGTFYPTCTSSVYLSGRQSYEKTTVLKPATIGISDSDGHELFRLTRCWTNNGKVYASWNIYAAGNNGVTQSCGNNSYDYHVSYAYCCKNGVIIFVALDNSTSSVPIRIVKTNNGKLAFIVWRGSSAYPPTNVNLSGYFQDQDCMTYDDVVPFKTYTFSNRYDIHYVVVPLLTNSQAEVVSYTDKSGFLPYSTQDGIIKVISINGKKYLTDSFFAIEDE